MSTRGLQRDPRGSNVLVSSSMATMTMAGKTKKDFSQSRWTAQFVAASVESEFLQMFRAQTLGTAAVVWVVLCLICLAALMTPDWPGEVRLMRGQWGSGAGVGIITCCLCVTVGGLFAPRPSG